MIHSVIQLLGLLIVLAVGYFIVQKSAAYFELPVILVQIVGLILGLIFLLATLTAFGIAPAGFGGKLGC